MDTQTTAVLLLVVYFIIGVIFCFFGNRWLKIIVAIYGFAVGFLIANTLIHMLTTLSGIPSLLICIGAGIVGAALFVFFVYLGIFFIGFGGGVLLSILFADAFNLNVLDWYVYIPVLIISSVFGALTLNLRRIFVSIFTSFIGAFALAQVIYQLWGDIQPQALVLYSDQQVMYGAYTSTVYLVSLAALFFIGLVVQLAITSKQTSAH
ncbi:MAG: DUF4203 domain-containing protein [Christensenellales bacterium]|jgi:hypothetical protein